VAEPLRERAPAFAGALRSAPAARLRGRDHDRYRLAPVAIMVGVAVVAVTVVLTAVSYSIYQTNEQHLLKLRAREVGLVVQDSVPGIQTALASAAALADVTGGSGARFASFAGAYVGRGKNFISMSLWRANDPRPVAELGSPPLIASSPGTAQAFIARVGRRRTFSVMLLSSDGALRLGYGYRQPGGAYVAYGESQLPPTRRAPPTPSSSPFSDLNYALYLGRSQNPANLLATDLAKLPPSGRAAVDVTPWGDSAITIVVTARGSLAGSFFELLPWIIGAVGCLLALASAIAADRLARRRLAAETLARRLDRRASEISGLLSEQRTIAQTLQEAILPEALPTLPGIETAGLYAAGTVGIEVGGDWYELIEVKERCLVGIVGDVSGHGLRAATTMATLRTAAFAYAARDASPASLLEHLNELIARKPHNYFATVLCMLIDIDERRIRLASAGHLPPLVINGTEASFVEVHVGPPVGATMATYEETTIEVGEKTTIIAFTDGLIERRGEIIDRGLERLRGKALAHRKLPLAKLLETLSRELVPEQAHDDTAIIAVRWKS
jgi:serine phosphatase RsbU (regulator of sigma subunit)